MLSTLLVNIAKKHKDQMADYLRTLDLYVGQDIFLLTLAQNGEMSQTSLKEELNVQYSTIHKIVSRLDKRGVIVKATDPDDNRVSVISLNEEGKKVTAKIEQYWQKLEKEFFSPLNEDEKQKLYKLLGKLNN